MMAKNFDNSDFSTIVIPELYGQSGDVKLRLLNTPFLHSSRRNITKFIELAGADFHVLMLDEIDNNIRAKEETRFLLKKVYYCRLCDTALETSHEQTHQFAFSIILSNVPTFQVQIEIPAVKCSRCNAENVIETFVLSSNIIEAQTEAFAFVLNL